MPTTGQSMAYAVPATSANPLKKSAPSFVAALLVVNALLVARHGLDLPFLPSMSPLVAFITIVPAMALSKALTLVANMILTTPRPPTTHPLPLISRLSTIPPRPSRCHTLASVAAKATHTVAQKAPLALVRVSTSRLRLRARTRTRAGVCDLTELRRSVGRIAKELCTLPA